MPHQQPSSGNARVYLLLLTITLVVAVVQIYFGLNSHLGFDETWHIAQAGERGLWKSFVAMSGDIHPPLHYLLIRAALKLGTDPIYARLPNIIASILTIPLWYGLMRKLQIGVPTALTVTLVLAGSYAFLHLGVLVRSYSITLFLLLGALYFWSNMLPATNGQPSRGSAVASLALFSLAFWALYPAIFVTATVFIGTFLIMVFNQQARGTILNNWRNHSAWPEWTLFVFAHLLCLGWYALTWGTHISFSAPEHTVEFTLASGQTPLEFLSIALRQELALFSPLFGLSDYILDLGLVVILSVSLWLAVRSLRRGEPARAILALAPLLITAILATFALIGRYPLGGWMRHQYVLFPFLLLLLALTMDTVWETLAKRWLKVALVTLIITMSAITLARTLETKRIGQEAVPLNWASEIGTLFQHTVSEPTLVPAVSFFPLFYQRLKPGIDYLASYEVDRRGYHLAYQGWLAIGMPWPAYQEYSVTTDDGGQAIIIKDHYRWVFAPVPDDLFFTQTRRILERLEQSSVRVFALQLNPKTRQDEEGLRAAAERNGFTITEFTLLKYGALWRTRVNAEKPQPAGQQGNPATTTP